MKNALVSKNIGSVRAKSELTSTLEDEVFYGMKVEILKSIGEMYEIRTHYQYKGFMHKSELVTDEEIIKDFDCKEKLMVINSYADVLSIPDVEGAILVNLTRGAQIVKVSEANKDGWIKVKLIEGKFGFIKEKFVKNCFDSLMIDTYRNYCNNLESKERIKLYLKNNLNISEDKFRENVVKTALSYLGTPYRWGGKSPIGIDCSGLASMAYMLNGIIIYRDSVIKAEFPVREIDISNIKKADLLFYNGHVVVYIGNSNYIHSTAKNGIDGVVINSLNPKHKNYREDLACSIEKVGTIF